jgi:hypothetical protein
MNQRKWQSSSRGWVHFNILALGFLGGRAEARPYQRRRAYFCVGTRFCVSVRTITHFANNLKCTRIGQNCHFVLILCYTIHKALKVKLHLIPRMAVRLIIRLLKSGCEMQFVKVFEKVYKM